MESRLKGKEDVIEDPLNSKIQEPTLLMREWEFKEGIDTIIKQENLILKDPSDLALTSVSKFMDAKNGKPITNP
jgi:hypothetical protein